MLKLDRPGIFKAKPFAWFVRNSEQSQSVSISIEFVILEQLDGTEWADWSQYEEHSIIGDFWVVKKDGSINVNAVENLVEAVGWDCNLTSVAGPAPDVVVQITVQEEEYRGNTRLKVAWLNPGDFTPRPQSAAPEQVQQLQSRFGSLLRAAAGSALKKPGNGKPAAATPAAAPAVAPAAAARPRPAARPTAPAPENPPHPAESAGDNDNDLPF